MRKIGGKGKSDEIKEIKMEMNRAVEILTTRVFPSQVALIASSEICFYPVKIALSQTARSHTYELHLSLFFFIINLKPSLGLHRVITSRPLINPIQCWVSEPCTLSPEI